MWSQLPVSTAGRLALALLGQLCFMCLFVVDFVCVPLVVFVVLFVVLVICLRSLASSTASCLARRSASSAFRRASSSWRRRSLGCGQMGVAWLATTIAAIVATSACAWSRACLDRASLPLRESDGIWLWTNGVNTNGAAAKVMCLLTGCGKRYAILTDFDRC